LEIVTVIGARPQFVKASVVSQALKRLGTIREYIIHTGQHYDSNMSDVFFDELGIPKPDCFLGIGSSSHGQQTGRMLEGIEGVLMNHRPDLMLVYGDTNSTLAGAMAAAKLHIPVAHVEAGLRSFNRRMPEEINRVLTDHVSTFLFTPTQTAVENLIREGISGETIHQVGDVMYDVSLAYGQLSDDKSTVLGQLGLVRGEYSLATVHRAENTDDPSRLANIFKALNFVSQQAPVVLPIHPRTRNLLPPDIVSLIAGSDIRVVDPVGYLDMLQLEKHARTILTDSGGVQKEAYFFSVPCITLRDETEWVELVELGWNRLWSPSSSLERFYDLARYDRSSPPGSHPDIYGKGNSASLIASCLVSPDRA
jgi:UDP-GlcNAc3NAcA epimerase